jgi:signal transduction histidine kinase
VEPSRKPQSAVASATAEYVEFVGHVLMTPLSGIVLWCEMLLRKRGLPELAQRGLVAIDHGARAQAAILDNLLELSRLQAGSTELERSPVELATCIDDVIARCASAATQRRVTIRYIRPSSGWSVQGDALRLRTVLHNVVDNAIKASPPGGHVDIDVADAGAGFSIRVDDEGGGIAPEALPDLFTIGELGARRGQLGLGLPIARWVVELHGGSISFAPRAPRGTRFAIELPRG